MSLLEMVILYSVQDSNMKYRISKNSAVPKITYGERTLSEIKHLFPFSKDCFVTNYELFQNSSDWVLFRMTFKVEDANGAWKTKR